LFEFVTERLYERLTSDGGASIDDLYAAHEQEITELVQISQQREAHARYCEMMRNAKLEKQSKRRECDGLPLRSSQTGARKEREVASKRFSSPATRKRFPQMKSRRRTRKTPPMTQLGTQGMSGNLVFANRI
jgi:hypothetical protein